MFQGIGVPKVDSPFFEAWLEQGLFSPYESLAIQLNRDGFAVVDLSQQIGKLCDQIKINLGGGFDIDSWRAAGGDKNLRAQDAWQDDESVSRLALNQEILAILRVLYGKNPFPFQTLNFPVGTQQPPHSDSVHFSSLPHGFMCGVWVALEDIHQDSGPLIYYPGSHKLPYIHPSDLGIRNKDKVNLRQTLFHDYWETTLAELQIEPVSFLPRKGQCLIWAANLIHGGSAVADLAFTRWSQVTHYFFDDCAYYTPIASDWPGDQVFWRKPLNISTGERYTAFPQTRLRELGMQQIKKARRRVRNHFSKRFRTDSR